MGSKDPLPTVTEWIKFPWEQEPSEPITEDERAELVAEMNAWNEMFAKE
jgi:hypothetical protein